MLDWTDRHYRYFARQLSQHSWLYSEMVTTGALRHGDIARHLDFAAAEQPVALQLGGSDPTDLAYSAALAERWGYAEINLNIGCPSERVQNGAFGACLMAEPEWVAQGVRAMCDAVSLPITVKHRIGIDAIESYDYVANFVGTVAAAGCHTFIVHARNAILKGLSPKENREIPPLNYPYVYRLKREFPQLEIIINGGIRTLDDIDTHLAHVDGVMIGREAYHNPYLLAAIDARYYGATLAPRSRAEVIAAMEPYIAHHLANGGHAREVVRHLLSLYLGMPGARRFRRYLSDAQILAHADAALLQHALNAMILG